MTDKEIIINGIDVSECEHLNYEHCEIDYDEWNGEIIRYNKCQDNPNCYFKQLKRKEQECEEINLTNERLVAEKYTLNEEILKLKEQLNNIQDDCLCFNDCSYKQCDKGRIDKYEQALKNINSFLNLSEGKSNNYRLMKIRDIINEVLYNEE